MLNCHRQNPELLGDVQIVCPTFDKDIDSFLINLSNSEQYCVVPSFTSCYYCVPTVLWICTLQYVGYIKVAATMIQPKQVGGQFWMLDCCFTVGNSRNPQYITMATTMAPSHHYHYLCGYLFRRPIVVAIFSPLADSLASCWLCTLPAVLRYPPVF